MDASPKKPLRKAKHAIKVDEVQAIRVGFYGLTYPANAFIYSNKRIYKERLCDTSSRL
jgi:hypothetical protein